MLSDLRFALRQLGQARTFTFMAVLSLALGIGANTTVFSLVNEFLLRPLPVHAPEELVIFRQIEGERGGLAQSTEGYGSRDPATGRSSSSSFPLALAERFRAHPDVLAETFAFAPFWECHVLIDGAPETGLRAQLVSGHYFSGLGVPAQIGRSLGPEDDRANAEPVAVISHRLWQRRFGGSDAVLGRTLQLNKVTVTIVGVAPAGFAGSGQIGEHVDLHVPLAQHARFDPESGAERELLSTWWVRLMARLRPGVSATQAQAVLEPLFVETAREGWRSAPRAGPAGEMPGAPALRAEPGFQGEVDNRRRYTQSLQLMLGLVALVLLAACANVANLLLARGAGRRRELAVRLALGASRGRLVRQLLAESLLLAIFAAGAGLLLAGTARGALLALQPFGAESANLTLPLDGRVLLFTLAATLATTLIFGLAPALRSTRLDLTREFQGGRGSVGAQSWLSRALMVVQIALSFLLLACTGLLVRSLHNLQSIDAGFDRSALLLFSVNLSSAGLEGAPAQAFREQASERFATLPGVRAATYSRVPVLSRYQHTSSVLMPGVAPPPGADSLDAHFNAVAPNFFALLEQPLVLGRAFTAADGPTAPKVAIVNETFVRRYLAGQNPVGRRFHFEHDQTEIEIVGVARDIKYADLRSTVPPTIYQPAAQRPGGYAHFMLRHAGEPAALAAALRGVLREIDPTLPVLNLRSMDEQVDRLHGQERLFARMAGFFGALSLLLACVGLYGLMSYSVLCRTGEVGVRLALGAVPAQILRLFLGESGRLIAVGLTVGGLAAWGAAQLLTKMLFGLSALDGPTYSVAALLLAGVAAASAALPAWRAARIEPTAALRSE